MHTVLNLTEKLDIYTYIIYFTLCMQLISLLPETSINYIIYSCDKTPWLEELNFWIFEGSITAIGIVSSLIVKVRQKQLDKTFLERIQKQVAAGV